MIDLAEVRYVGPAIDDHAIPSDLPAELRTLYTQINGCILFGGGLHVRGLCVTPEWHSLRAAWRGPSALHLLYDVLTVDDVPFAQDALGDQFALRGGEVHCLSGETGELEASGASLNEFLAAAKGDPVEFLSLWPLLQFDREGGRLEPGQLLSAYPPFCTKESAAGVNLRAVPASERIAFLSHFAREIAGVKNGDRIEIRTE